MISSFLILSRDKTTFLYFCLFNSRCNCIMLEVFNNIWQSGSNLATSACSSTYGKKIVEFIVAPVDKKSARETYYTHSNYISEHYCTISNIPMLIVGLYYGDYSAVAAASFSILSHAIPSQRLHDLDILGVGLVGFNIATNYDVILKKPDILIWGGGAMALNVLDSLLARNVSSEPFEQIEPWLHVAWHLSAGLALYKFNKAKEDLSNQSSESTNDTSNQCKNYLPGYDSLQRLANSCSEYIPQALKGIGKFKQA